MRVKINDQKISYFFNGLTGTGTVFTARLIRLGVSSGTVDTIIRDAPVVIKRDLTLGAVQGNMLIAYSMQVESQQFRNTAPLTNQDILIVQFSQPLSRILPGGCPECGYKQPKDEICLKRVHMHNKKQDRK